MEVMAGDINDLIRAVEKAGADAKAAEEQAKALRETLMARLKGENLLVQEDDGGIRFRGTEATVTLVMTARESFITAEEAMDKGTIPPRFLKKALKVDGSMLKKLEASGMITADQVASIRDGDPTISESLRLSRRSK